MLSILRALKERKQQGQECEDLLRDLARRLSRFRGTIRRMVGGQLADEEAILNTALQSIFNAIEGFRSGTEGEAVTYCAKAVKAKTLSHIRAAKGRLIFVGGTTSQVPGYAGDHSEENLTRERSLESIPQTGVSNSETQILRKQMLQEALSGLNPQERELLVRVVVLGERITDIAEQTGTPPNTLTQQKNRALRKMRQYLQSHYEV